MQSIDLPGSSVVAGQDRVAGASLASLSAMPVSARLPVLVTVKVYFTLSPALVGVPAAFLTTWIAGFLASLVKVQVMLSPLPSSSAAGAVRAKDVPVPAVVPVRVPVQL